MAAFRRYAGHDADNARWEGFELRAGDIVISAPSKCGTTWTQRLCSLLVFDGPDLPAPLSEVSPWLDMKTRTVEDVHRSLDAQRHRRFIKTHSPLDGVPREPGVRYLAIGRDPRDAAISLIHHQRNMDRTRLAELLEAAGATPRPAPSEPAEEPAGLGAALRAWIDDTPAAAAAEPLAEILEHYEIAWARRDDPDVALFHFADYVADLPGELQRLAQVLGYDLEPARIHALAAEASLDRMRDQAAVLAPNAGLGLWKDDARFFRSGLVGEWRTVLDAADVDRYRRRVASLVGPDVARWAEHGRQGGSGRS